ncbi:MAG: DNA-3-methyladenine glycosylase 2 family protein [Rhodothermales bacterium]|nr:DNA-3-methyladenine glycosylase 2 family protein [Rhodothermales bacterium]
MELNYDPVKAVRHLKRVDPNLKNLINAAGPFTVEPKNFNSPFLLLLRTIVYQQLSGKAAATIFGRVEDLFPSRRQITPGRLFAIPDEELRAAGMSWAKVAAAKDLAAKCLARQVPSKNRLTKMSNEEVLDTLVQIRGIGPWTVEMLLMFHLGRPDVLPVSDLGVRKGYQLTYELDELPKPKELYELCDHWRPYRSVGSWYMWRAVDLLG